MTSAQICLSNNDIITAYETCYHVARGCYPIIMRHQDAPIHDGELEEYSAIMKACCKAYGLRYPGISKDLTKITGRIILSDKEYKLQVHIINKDKAEYSIGTV